MRSRTASWVPSTPGGEGEGAGAWAPQIREPRLPNPRKDQDALQRAFEALDRAKQRHHELLAQKQAFERAKQRHQELLAQKQPVQIRFRSDPVHACGTVPPDHLMSEVEVAGVEAKIEQLKYQTAAHDAGFVRLCFPEYLSRTTEGRYAQKFGQALEKKNQKGGRDWVARLAYDAHLMANAIVGAGGAEYGKQSALPDLRYYGYKRLEAFNDDYPDANTLLHHLFEKHHGELISVRDQWWPIYSPLAEAPHTSPFWHEAACGAPWDPEVFFHNQTLSAAQRQAFGVLRGRGGIEV